MDDWLNEEINHYRLFLKKSNKDQKYFEIEFVCLIPSLTFQ
jgi:hypothetical protein